MPEHYDAPAVGAVEENARLKLQVVRLGEVLLASCACEPQMDLVRNLESRIDDVRRQHRRRVRLGGSVPSDDVGIVDLHGRRVDGRGAGRPDRAHAGRGAQRRRGVGRSRLRPVGQRRAGRPGGHQGELHPHRAPGVPRVPLADRARARVGLQRLHGVVPGVHGSRPLPQGAHELRPAHRRLHEHQARGPGRRPSRAAPARGIDRSTRWPPSTRPARPPLAAAIGLASSAALDTWMRGAARRRRARRSR